MMLRVLVIACAVAAFSGCASLQSKSSAEELTTFLGEGERYFDNADYEQALNTWRHGLQISRERDATRYVGSFLTNLGVAYLNAGYFDKALNTQTEALATKRQLGDRSGEATNLTNIGNIYLALGRYDDALDYFHRSLKIERRLQQRGGEAIDLTNIATAHAYLGEYGDALSYARRALRIHRALEDREGESANLNNIGVFQKNLGQLEAAEASFRHALAIARDDGYRHGQATSLGNLGFLYSDTGRFDAARRTLLESEALLKNLAAVDLLWKVQIGLGRIEVQTRRYQAAEGHYVRALDSIEQLRAGIQDDASETSFVRGKLVAYDELISLYAILHELDPDVGFAHKALAVFERKQGRAFLEEMGKSGARRFSGLPDPVRQREIELERGLMRTRAALTSHAISSDALRALHRDLDDQLDQVERFRAQLKAEYPRYYALKYPSPASVEVLQAALASNEKVLAYHVMPTATLAWLITPDGLEFYRIDVGNQQLEEWAVALRAIAAELIAAIQRQEPGFRLQRFADRLREPWDNAAALIYQKLFPEALRKQLKLGGVIYIIPSDSLYDIPFEALVTSAANRPVRYLVQDHAVAYLSSASLLPLLRQSSVSRSASNRYPFLAFADPVYSVGGEDASTDVWSRQQTRTYVDYLGGNFSAIPQAAQTARAIEKILAAPARSEPLRLGEDASRETVMRLNAESVLKNYQYLYFGVHGILPGEVTRILQPALALSHPERYGYLTMADVLALSLDADLVTLSACNTARGEAIRGEGIRGLTRAFMYAGADTVGATMWSVEAASIHALSEGLYRNLAQGIGQAQALRQVKLRLIENEDPSQSLYHHPYFWAPLVLFGDGA